jgi:predicted nucleotidyltransferase
VRTDFNEGSDIDLLIEFNDSEKISFMNLIDIQDYFEQITVRPGRSSPGRRLRGGMGRFIRGLG